VGTLSADAVWEEVETPLKLKLDPQKRLTRSTGLEDYGYWFKEMAKQHKTEADSPFGAEKLMGIVITYCSQSSLTKQAVRPTD
jgi:cyanobactin cluster PatC/TenC/TruC protein